MLDPKLLRNGLQTVARALLRRGYVLDVDAYSDMENKRKQYQKDMEDLRNVRNAKSKEIGHAKAKGEDTAD